MIFDSDTVVDPGAVMVIPVNTFVTDDTMSGAARPNDLAFGTQALRFKSLQKFHKTYSLIFHVSRVFTSQTDMRDHR